LKNFTKNLVVSEILFIFTSTLMETLRIIGKLKQIGFIVRFDTEKGELVYYTTKHGDGELIGLATLCLQTNRRLVLIIPTTKEYTRQINDCFRILGDDLLVYEISMGTRVVLASRARKYVEYIKNAELHG